MDTSTFTVRDLSRNTAKVLQQAERLGSVLVRTRAGKSFSITTLAPTKDKGIEIPDFDAHHRHLRELGCVAPTQEEMERLDRIIAGEE